MQNAFSKKFFILYVKLMYVVLALRKLGQLSCLSAATSFIMTDLIIRDSVKLFFLSNQKIKSTKQHKLQVALEGNTIGRGFS